MTPRPGAARMYPETDVPPVQISPERIRQIADNLPRMPEELAKEIGSKYEIGPKLAIPLVNSDYLGIFEGIVSSAKGDGASFVDTVMTAATGCISQDKVRI